MRVNRYLRKNILEVAINRYMKSLKLEGMIHAVVHVPFYDIERFHGVLFFLRADNLHTVITARKSYRWINEIGAVIDEPMQKVSCPVCNNGNTFQISDFVDDHINLD